MKAKQVNGKWRIKVGWWIFGYYLLKPFRSYEGILNREYEEFDTKEKAEKKIKELCN